MIRIWVRALVWTLLVVGLSAIGAKTMSYSDKGSLILQFWDSETGYAIYPTYLAIRNLESGEFESTNGSLPPGHYSIEIRSKGYETMAAQTEVFPAAESRLTFHLDPQNPSEKLKLLSSLHRPEHMIVAGYVVNEAGQPLANVDVEDTKSDSEGFFCAKLPSGSRYVSVTVRKPGFVSQNLTWIESWPNGDAIFKIRLKEGNGVEVLDQRRFRHRDFEAKLDDAGCDTGCDQGVEKEILPEPGVDSPNPPAMPKNIRVGRNCNTATTCTSVEVYSVDTYAKHVLAAEWYSCWGSLNGGINAMKAGAVSVRSYGLYHVYNPRTSTYDICDTTSCQVFGSSTSTNANAGVDQTSGYVLTSNGAIARAEYSSENNNAGCGDGFSGTGSSTAPCISDQPCAGFSTFGHGRGLCQFGSARWAAGTRITTSSPCSAGVSHGLGQQTWQWILNHYYPNYVLQQGAVLNISSLTATPNPANAGSSVTLDYSTTATAPVDNVFVGASIRLNGTTPLISDPPHDILVNFVTGSNPVSRTFDLAPDQTIGSYDLLGSLYYDRNNSGTLNAGDFLMADITSLNALTVQSQNILVSVSPQRAKLLPGRTKQFTATVQNSTNQTVTWSIVTGPGIITTGGLYIAANDASAGPAKTVIKATSVANPSRSATATVFTMGY